LLGEETLIIFIYL